MNSNMSDKKILVTGATGFIGSHLVKVLRESFTSVTPIDRRDGDIRNEQFLKELVSSNFDCIYHLAGLSGGAREDIGLEEFFQSNTVPITNLCRLIRELSPRTRLVLSGSRLEYGHPQYLPVDENHPVVPFSDYGLSKMAANQFALGYNLQFGLDVVIFRTSNVYGSHTHDLFQGYNVINHFLDLACAGEDLVIYGDGSQQRDYIYIDDLTRAFVLVGLGGNEVKGQIFNLGLGEGITVAEMAMMIVRMVKKGKVVHRDWPKNYLSSETGDYISDISKIKKLLNFSPTISFEEGITLSLKQ